MQWGDRWLQRDRAPVELHHSGCGAKVRAELRCAEGHPVDLKDLDLVLRAGRPSARRAAAKTA